MLSILIPIYNQKVVKLVDELIDQCTKAKINFEIICLDDKSKPQYKSTNQEVNGRFNVNYVELTKNIGRSRIRNRLAKLARYHWLLFLDSDSKIKSKKFIKRYVTAIEELGHPQSCIFIGGTKYQKSAPTNLKKELHWNYGTKREAVSAKSRSKHPWRYFHSNNFVIARPLIWETPFNEKLNSYGYEDLAFGQLFKEQGSQLFHLENPINHTGLKDFDTFIADQKSAMNNLALLYHQRLLTDTKLIVWYERMVYSGFKSSLVGYIKRQENKLLHRLKSNPKKLIRLDLLKLLYFDEALNHAFFEAESRL